MRQDKALAHENARKEAELQAKESKANVDQITLAEKKLEEAKAK